MFAGNTGALELVCLRPCPWKRRAGNVSSSPRCRAERVVRMRKQTVAILFHLPPLNMADRAQLAVYASASLLPVKFKSDFLENCGRDCGENRTKT